MILVSREWHFCRLQNDQHNKSFVVLSLSRVPLFATSWTAACQVSLSFTISWSLLKVMTIESMMPSNHLILCRPLLLPSIFPSIRVFSNESAHLIKWQSIGASASASVLPMNILGWFHLGLTDLISLQSKGLSRIFFSTTISPKFHAVCRKTEATRSQIR